MNEVRDELVQRFANCYSQSVMLDNRAYSCANQAITSFEKLHLQTRMVQTMGQSSVFLSADSS